MVGILTFGIAIGGIALALEGVEWNSPGSWPNPVEVIKAIPHEVGSLEDVLTWWFGAAGIYILSFVACLRSWWIVPFALAGFFIQLFWMVRAMSEEDEEPWLLAAVVPIVAWQVFACVEYWSSSDLIVSIAFLASFTICWVTWFVVRDWMRLRDLSLWELIDTRRPRFDPAFFRWRKPSEPQPADAPSEPQ